MYTLGEAVELRFVTEASSATLQVQAPDGQPITVAAPTRDGDALRTVLTPPAPGRYTYRCVAGGQAWQDVFHVRPGRSLALCSLAGAKRHLNMDLARSVDDLELRGHIESATVVIERHRNEIVAARQFVTTARAGQLLPYTPIVQVVSATDSAGAVDVADWTVGADGLAWVPPRVREATVTVLAGYPVVPDAFVLAAEIIAAHLWETQRMSSLEGASLTDDQYLTPSGLGYAIPNRAVQLLGGRPPVIA